MPPKLCGVEKEARRGAKVERTSQPDRYEAALTAMINEIAAVQPDDAFHPLILVLDNYHVIETEAIYAGLTFLSDYPTICLLKGIIQKWDGREDEQTVKIFTTFFIIWWLKRGFYA